MLARTVLVMVAAVAVGLIGIPRADAFSPELTGSTQTHHRQTGTEDVDRRSVQHASDRRHFVTDLLLGSAAATVPLWNVDAANASGGATAGGAYLLSAKQRYNERVTKAIRGLLAAEEALEAGDKQAAQQFFSGDEAGTWKDVTAAGYLLSNAFRRNSTAAPDSLPAVKKWKAFAAEVEAYQKLLKKKGPAVAADYFPKVEAALTTWLEEVDLPAPREL